MAKYIGYAGTYTKGGSEGIYCFELDTEAKRLSRPKLAAKLEWIADRMTKITDATKVLK